MYRWLVWRMFLAASISDLYSLVMVFLNNLIKCPRYYINRDEQNYYATNYFNEQFKCLFAFWGEYGLHTLFSLPNLFCIKRKRCQPSTPQIDILLVTHHLRVMQTQHPLRQWRKTHKIVLKNLAYDAGTTIATLSRLERGLQFPRSTLLFRLVKITKLNLNDFLPADTE